MKVLLLCCALQFVACDRQPSPDVMDEVHLVEQRIVSSEDPLEAPPVTAKRPGNVEVHCHIQSQSTPQVYLGRVTQELGTEYHVISQSDSDLVLGQTLPGDVYTLELKSKPSGSGSKIDVRCFAAPT